MATKARRPGHIHRTLRLQHHRHTARKLEHRHTSFHGLAIVVVLAGLFIVGLNAIAKATADSIHVYGKVSAPIPTTAAVITNPVSGAVARPGLTVEGTCPVMTPAVIVVIAVDGTEVGSANCTDGTFAVPILIMPGQHTIVARLYNITEDRGPDSEPVYVVYSLPVPPATTGPTTQEDGIVSAFTFYQDDPFIVFGPAKAAVWSGTFTGGVLPYYVHITWGDGKSDDYVLDASGNHTFDHFYRTMKPYDMTITAKDKDGRGMTAHYAAVTPYRSPSSLLSITQGPSTPGFGTLLIVYASYLLVLVILALLWKQRREFAYAHITVRAQPAHRQNRSQPAGASRSKSRRR